MNSPIVRGIVTVYEALTGRAPRTVRPVSTLVPGLDPRWDAFLFRLLEDRPQDRFASAAEARAALAALTDLPHGPPAEGRVTVVSASPGAPPRGRWWGPGLLWVVASVGAALGLVAGRSTPDAFPLLLLVAALVAAVGVLALVRGRRRSATPAPDALEQLVAGVERLRRAKVGALIAVERANSLQRLVATGTPVNTRLHADLLASFFVPGAPLQDGAVVLRAGRIAAAGCFLPLSSNPDLDPALGTRPRAALGLSEETDAVVVVVSEDTGRVSTAQRGRLTAGLDRPALAAALERSPLPRTEEDAADGAHPRPPAATRGRERRRARAAAPGETDGTLHRQRLIFYEDDIERINATLRAFQARARTRCTLLIDVEGIPVTAVGATNGVHIETVAALVAASFAATREVAKVLGGTRFSTLTHEGDGESVHLSFVGERTLLATIFDPEEAAAGEVSSCQEELRERLDVIFDELRTRGRRDDPPPGGAVLDDLFGDA